MSRATRWRRCPRAADRLETIAPGINLDRFDPASVRADRVIRLAAELRVPDGRHLVICAARDEAAASTTLIEAIKRLGPRRRVLPAARARAARRRRSRRSSSAPSCGPSCRAACRSAPMSRTCRRPTCWPTSWWRPAARGRDSAARWSRRRRWAGRWSPRKAAAPPRRCGPASPAGWRPQGDAAALAEALDSALSL